MLRSSRNLKHIKPNMEIDYKENPYVRLHMGRYLGNIGTKSRYSMYKEGFDIL